MTRDQSLYHDLLSEYAAGALDEACALAVATHLSLSPTARKIVEQYESVGGTILHTCCAPAAMKPDALEKALARVENLTAKADNVEKPPEGQCHDYNALPSCVKKYVAKSCNGMKWQETAQGVRTISIKTCCTASKARLYKLAPGVYVQDYVAQTPEITLVLQGVFEDESGSFQRGELFVTQENTARRPHSGNNGCLYLVVTKSNAPGGLLGALMRLFQR